MSTYVIAFIVPIFLTALSSGALIRDLDAAISQHTSFIFAINTKHSYRTHLTTYMDYCNQVPMSVTTQCLCWYIAYLASKLLWNRGSQTYSVPTDMCSQYWRVSKGIKVHQENRSWRWHHTSTQYKINPDIIPPYKILQDIIPEN